MLGQLNSNQPSVKLQSGLANWLKIIQPLYLSFVPQTIQHRRNIDQTKLSDPLLIALMCWQVDLKMTVQTRFYQFLTTTVFTKSSLPAWSRFNRLCRQAWINIQFIRIGLIKTAMEKLRFTIIDSLPMPLCAPVRNLRAKALKSLANIGYNATKKVHYYGFKGSFEVGNNGLVLAYTITKASIHDIKMVKTLLHEYSSPQVLADVGYLSKTLKADLLKQQINFWTPVRHNMPQPKQDQRLLNRLRRRIETTFSQLVNLFDIERFRVWSLTGFQSRLEQCLLVHNLRILGIN